MTESQQSKRGWFSSWREQRRATHQQRLERRSHEHELTHGPGGHHRTTSPYQHGSSAAFFGGFGGDGGGCGGDGGGGGC